MRRSAMFVSLLLLAAAAAVHAEPGLRVSAAFEPPKALLGTPVSLRVTLTNDGQVPVSVPAQRHFVFVLRWRIEGVAGVRRPEGGPHPGRIASDPLDVGQSRTFVVSAFQQSGHLPQFCDPGRHELTLSLDLSRLDPARGGTAPIMTTVMLEVEEPVAGDADAYEHLVSRLAARPALDLEHCAAAYVSTSVRGAAGDLLQRFPTSTYAAYVVWNTSLSRNIANAEARVASYELSSGRVSEIAVPCEEGEACPDRERTGYSRRYAEQALAWREKWLNIVLRAHPDVFFADELRLRLAVDRFLAHAPEVGRAELEALAKGGRADVATKAAELLQLVREKGLVK